MTSPTDACDEALYRVKQVVYAVRFSELARTNSVAAPVYIDCRCGVQMMRCGYYASIGKDMADLCPVEQERLREEYTLREIDRWVPEAYEVGVRSIDHEIYREVVCGNGTFLEDIEAFYRQQYGNRQTPKISLQQRRSAERRASKGEQQ